MTAEDQVRTALARLKVFPLPNSALLPGGSVGLHVFEPRYRALVAEALEGDKVLALPMLAPGWEPEKHGKPELRPIAGAGVIEAHRRLPDGRFDLQVRGIMRIRIVGEHAVALGGYREVIAEELADRPALDLSSLDAVRSCILALCQALPGEIGELLAEEVAQISDPGRLCDVAASDLLVEPGPRQTILEAIDVQRRMEALIGELSVILAQIRGMQGGEELRS